MGVLVVVPGLVLFIGVLLTAIGLSALTESALALGSEQLQARNRMVGRQLAQALAQADVISARLRTIAATRSSSAPFDDLAFTLRDLIEGRPGISYVSLSFPDGTFQGAYVDTDGRVRFQDSRLEAAGTRVRRYDTDGRAALKLYIEERSTYDPREREFYRLALASPTEIWTKPYPFFKTQFTGVTRAEAVRGAGGETLAVLTVDFDVHELSRYLERIPQSGSRLVLYAEDGTLLGDTAGAARLRGVQVAPDETIKLRHLQDPLLDGMAAVTVTRADGSTTFEASGERYLLNRVRVGSEKLGWHVASLVPEAVLLQPVDAYRSRSRLWALLSLALASGVAVLFSRHIVRMRRQTAAARAVAKRAVAEATELGSYRLTSLLGKGGMGEVWRAEHRLLAREVAIKLMRSEQAPGFDSQERFRREAQTLAALRSRNTIGLFDYGVTDEGTFFYVMELLDGMDLETLVTRFGPQAPSRVRSLMLQACSSLAEAHVAGLVHRDIKPANLYICRAADEVDVLKVLDFGLVRTLGDSVPAQGHSLEDLAKELDSGTAMSSQLTAAGAVMGTPDYMAPEQILGLETDRRTDIYALGGVAYFLLCGKLPFPTERDAMATMVAHLQTEPKDLASQLTTPLPEGMSELIMRCLEKRPEDRPQSMSALRSALAELDCSQPWSEDEADEWWAQNVPRPASTSSGAMSVRRA